MVPAFLLALAAVTGADTMREASIEGFASEHAMLASAFDAALQKAVASAATRNDRAGLVLFLRVELLPHAAAEERVLYPAVDSVLGTRGYATATMVLDHKAILRLTDELAALAAGANADAFNRKALALGAVLQNHFAKEEEFILPILRERLKDRDLRALFARMRTEATL